MKALQWVWVLVRRGVVTVVVDVPVTAVPRQAREVSCEDEFHWIELTVFRVDCGTYRSMRPGQWRILSSRPTKYACPLFCWMAVKDNSRLDDLPLLAKSFTEGISCDSSAIPS